MKTEPLAGLPPDVLAERLDRVFKTVRKDSEPYAVTANYLFTERDTIDSLQVNATAATLTISLPSPTGNRRRRIIKTDNTANTVAVTAGGTILINAATTVVLTYQYEFVEVEPTGTSWLIIARGTLFPSANGIVFPATQVPSADPNTLDDYEEGTWTPVLAFGGASVGITYNIQAAVYTKIGRLVSIQGRVLLTSKGSSTGDATITGLPFANNATVAVPAAVYGNNLAAGVTSPVAITVGANGSTLQLFKYATGTQAALQDTDCTNTTDFAFGCTYSV